MEAKICQSTELSLGNFLVYRVDHVTAHCYEQQHYGRWKRHDLLL